MKILTKGNLVDLEAPIQMAEDQLKDFLVFLKELTNEDIKLSDVKEKERFANQGERHPRKWTAEELFLLLKTDISEVELSNKLNRSVMSVLMHRANFVPEFISWAKSKGYDSSNITQNIIELFMEDKNENTKGR